MDAARWDGLGDGDLVDTLTLAHDQLVARLGPRCGCSRPRPAGWARAPGARPRAGARTGPGPAVRRGLPGQLMAQVESRAGPSTKASSIFSRSGGPGPPGRPGSSGRRPGGGPASIRPARPSGPGRGRPTGAPRTRPGPPSPTTSPSATRPGGHRRLRIQYPLDRFSHLPR